MLFRSRRRRPRFEYPGSAGAGPRQLLAGALCRQVRNTTCFHADMPEKFQVAGRLPPGGRAWRPRRRLPCAWRCVRLRTLKRVAAGPPPQSPVTPPGVLLHVLSFVCVCVHSRCACMCVIVSEPTRAGRRGWATAGQGPGPRPSFGHASTRRGCPQLARLCGSPSPPHVPLATVWSPYSQCPEDWGPHRSVCPQLRAHAPKYLEINERVRLIP